MVCTGGGIVGTGVCTGDVIVVPVVCGGFKGPLVCTRGTVLPACCTTSVVPVACVGGGSVGDSSVLPVVVFTGEGPSKDFNFDIFSSCRCFIESIIPVVFFIYCCSIEFDSYSTVSLGAAVDFSIGIGATRESAVEITSICGLDCLVFGKVVFVVAVALD